MHGKEKYKLWHFFGGVSWIVHECFMICSWMFSNYELMKQRWLEVHPNLFFVSVYCAIVKTGSSYLIMQPMVTSLLTFYKSVTV